MAKRKAGVNDIIYELDNEDIELSSDDDSKETKTERLEDDSRKKQRLNIHISEGKSAKKRSEIINLDCSSDGTCDISSPNITQNGGKTTRREVSEQNCDKNETNGEDTHINDVKLQNNTLIFQEDIIVDSPTNSDLEIIGCENKSPLVTVRFNDRKLALAYKKKVKHFLIHLLKSHNNENESISGDSDVELDIMPEDLFEEKIEKIGDSEVFSKNEQLVDKVFYVDDSLFFVDTAPCDDSQTVVPKYSQSSSLISNIVEEEISSPNTLRRGPSCFNCDGAHQLKDCPMPRNHNRIAANRKAMPVRVGRYHVEDEQKYGHLIPGRISGTLRHALGLKRYELPLHIYRMRLLGYPPGWLEEAKISHSGITLFDSTGNAAQDPEEEDGELCEPGSRDKFDIKKVLDFPGFNVPASSQYVEEAHLFGLPQMSEHDSKMGMLQALAPNAMKAYKRKKLSFFPSANQNSSLAGQAEMELDSGDEIAEFPSRPPLPDEEPPLPAPPPPPPPPGSPPPSEKADEPDSKIFEKSKSDKSSNTKGASKNYNNNKDTVKRNERADVIVEKEKLAIKGEIKANENLNSEKQDAVVDKVDLASSSDDELEVIDVMQVNEIPVPEDDLITIDGDDDDEDCDKINLSNGPNSPSLSALEEKKRLLIDALKGDDDNSSVELVVLDETFSDTSENTKEEKLEINDQTDIDNIGTCKADPEKTVLSKLISAESLKDDVDSSTVNEESKSFEGNTCDVKDTSEKNELTANTIAEDVSLVNEDRSTKYTKSLHVNEETNRVEKFSSSNEESENHLVVNEAIKLDIETPATKHINTPESKAGHVKNSLYGTPVLNVASPFVKLPSDDNFAKDICDVINFENLPNSTGKYKKISSLLKRVKSAVDRIQDS